MLLVKHIRDLRKRLDAHQGRIGFVPTMGALHEGHISLIQRSLAEQPLTVCSIFINPTQFNDPKDFEKYPVTLDRDIERLGLAGTDILFLPEVSEMYPKGTDTGIQYPIGYLDTVLDGQFRPGHFNGVSIIVHKLLNAVQPTHLYMGEKDFQQCLVVKQLIEQQHLPVELITCPTLREENGLAMSSRNMRLSPYGRGRASAMYQSLQFIRDGQKGKSFPVLQAEALQLQTQAGLEPEYLLLADADDLSLLSDFDAGKNMVVLAASRLEGIRLIDNLRM